MGAGAALSHWPEVLSLCVHGQMELERGELHPQGALGWGQSLELPSPAHDEGHGAVCGDKVSQRDSLGLGLGLG